MRGFLGFVDWTTSKLKALNWIHAGRLELNSMLSNIVQLKKQQNLSKKLLNKKNLRGHFTDTTYLARPLYTFISVLTVTLLHTYTIK